jgi:hypothetical protein
MSHASRIRAAVEAVEAARRASPEPMKRIMTTPFRASLLLLAGPGAAAAQACPDPAALVRGVDPALAVVRFLADDALEGRLAGSAGERCAGDFIAARFRALGLAPGGADGGYFDDVGLASALNPHAPGGTGRNVIAVLEGADPLLRREAIIIGAHYDHLGRGGFGSLAADSGAIHNGADDNASGVAALLRVAERLVAGERPARSVVFSAFTGEELGLLGSADFVASAPIPAQRMRAMLNMDMVGRLGRGPLIVNGVGTAKEWRALLERAAAEAGVALALTGDGYGPSDHTSFYLRDIPVLHFFTNVHGDYHKPSDDWQGIDAAGIEKVAHIVARVAGGLAQAGGTITLVRGAGTRPQDQARGYGAYLGSIPDFTPVERGVLLSGVSQGSPAEAAGMRAGDVILRLGDHDVADLQGLTDALRAHAPGDVVDVTVRRASEDLTFAVRLGSRSAR